MERAGVSVFVEVRSINNRYLKFTLRSDKALGAIENQIEEAVRKHISRGTVQVNVKITSGDAANAYRLNLPLLSAFRQQLTEWKTAEGLGEVTSEDLRTLLTLPGAVEDCRRDDDVSEQAELILETLGEALRKFVAMRQVEGQAMAQDLRANLADVRERLDRVIARAPEIAKIFGERLVERLNKLFASQNVEIAQSDVIREIGIFADRCDISEEIARLNSHLTQFDTILSSENTPGKKLDFLTQELFRETNTIGSKANDFAIAQEVIGMKSSIERIREQVQNIE